jgi:hypothetical protein
MNIQFRAFVGKHDWGWCQQQVQILRSEDTQGIMAIDIDKNETIGAVIFDNFSPNSVQAHLIITKPMLLRHGFLQEAFDFAFNVCDRKMMIGIVKSDNAEAQKLDKHIGFVEQYRLKDGHADGIDLIYYTLHRDFCRFLPEVKKEAVNVY